MRELFLFALIASIAGTICMVSLIELFFTVRRRKANQKLQQQLRDLKGAYNESINKMVLEQDSTLTTTEEQTASITANAGAEKENLEKSLKEQYDILEAKNKKALEAAEKKAKKLQDEAHKQADEYLTSRKKEIEEELMSLVISVSKKVLPTGISYDAHKELVMQALREVKTENR